MSPNSNVTARSWLASRRGFFCSSTGRLGGEERPEPHLGRQGRLFLLDPGQAGPDRGC
jgi:hypothetical protein